MAAEQPGMARKVQRVTPPGVFSSSFRVVSVTVSTSLKKYLQFRGRNNENIPEYDCRAAGPRDAFRADRRFGLQS